MKSSSLIRTASASDIEAITNIYNEAIENTLFTFDSVEKTQAQQLAWLATHDIKHPVWVIADNGEIVGYSSLSHYSDRCAYSEAAELSIFLYRSAQGKGLGKRLLKHTVEAAKELGFHTVVSRIAQDNEVSFHLHELFGFKQTGVLREVGRKFGKRLDVYFYQLIFS